MEEPPPFGPAQHLPVGSGKRLPGPDGRVNLSLFHHPPVRAPLIKGNSSTYLKVKGAIIKVVLINKGRFIKITNCMKNSERDILERLREMLVSDRFATPKRLPPERTLASDLGISRAVLRKALATLEREGKIWRHVGRGTLEYRQSH